MAPPSLIIKRSYNVEEGEAIITDPTIWKAISGIYINTATAKLADKRSHIYLIGYIDEVPIGLVILHPRRNKKYYSHIHVLPQYRARYSRAFGIASINWLEENTTINTVYTSIPNEFPNVVAYVISIGFSKAKYVSKNKSRNSIKSSRVELELDLDRKGK